MKILPLYLNLVERSHILSKIVQFNGNLLQPVHRWVRVKESFSPELVKYIIQRYGVAKDPATGDQKVLDPFAGSGTTIVTCSLLQEPIAAYAIEYNPFLAMVADVKAHAPTFNPDILTDAVQRILNTRHLPDPSLPDLGTLHQERYFPEGRARKLVGYCEHIKRMFIDPKIRTFLLVGLASIIEEVSCLRKDGRMLRYVPHQPRDVQEVLTEKWYQMIEDVKAVQRASWGNVFHGDARQPESTHPCQLTDQELPREGYGLILYSPPYLNSIDYSEIYKIELWLLEFVTNAEEFRMLRRGTVTSHPSVRVDSKPDLRSFGLDELAMYVNELSSHPDLGRAAERGWIIPAYFSDMTRALTQQVEMLLPGGHIVCIIGNSKYGNLQIDTDLLLAEIGQSLGLEVVALEIARWRNSRTTQGLKLRESIIVLRKPRVV